MAKAATMFLLAGAARALRGHRLHHLARPSRTVMSAATLDRTTPTKLQDAEAFLKDIDVFIFDCDGVIWKGDSLIPGVEKTLEMLRALKKRLFFVTVGCSLARLFCAGPLSCVPDAPRFLGCAQNNSTKSRKGCGGRASEKSE